MSVQDAVSWDYPGARWWKFDVHTHTPASSDFRDDDVAPQDWLLVFMGAGIDCVAVTDHNSGEWVDILREAASSIGGCDRLALMAGELAATDRWRFSVWHGGFVLRSVRGSRRWPRRGSAPLRSRSGWAGTARRCTASWGATAARAATTRGGGAGWVLCPGGQAQGSQAGR